MASVVCSPDEPGEMRVWGSWLYTATKKTLRPCQPAIYNKNNTDILLILGQWSNMFSWHRHLREVKGESKLQDNRRVDEKMFSSATYNQISDWSYQNLIICHCQFIKSYHCLQSSKFVNTKRGKVIKSNCDIYQGELWQATLFIITHTVEKQPQLVGHGSD